MLIVGERINSTLGGVGPAIERREKGFIQGLALRQVKAGAHFLEANVAQAPGDEPENMEWLVRTIQETVMVPLCIDSANPAAIEVALSRHQGRALVNSFSGEQGRSKEILPLVKKYSALAIGITVDPGGTPKSAEERVSTARLLVSAAQEQGVPPEDLYIDPCALPISVDPGAGAAVLKAIGEIKASLGVKVILGLSNVSFGLPRRRLLNRTFLASALALGLDAAILDPLDRQLMATLSAAQALLGEDEYCAAYLRAYRERRLDESLRQAQDKPLRQAQDETRPYTEMG